MWHVKKLIAVDNAGNTVEVHDNTVTVTVTFKSGIRISRTLPLDDTPPCLSVAVSDLIKIISETNPSA